MKPAALDSKDSADNDLRARFVSAVLLTTIVTLVTLIIVIIFLF